VDVPTAPEACWGRRVDAASVTGCLRAWGNTAGIKGAGSKHDWLLRIYDQLGVADGVSVEALKKQAQRQRNKAKSRRRGRP